MSNYSLRIHLDRSQICLILMLEKNHPQFCLVSTTNSLIGDHLVDIVDVDEGVIGSEMPSRVNMSVWDLSQWILHEQLDKKHV